MDNVLKSTTGHYYKDFYDAFSNGANAAGTSSTVLSLSKVAKVARIGEFAGYSVVAAAIVFDFIAYQNNDISFDKFVGNTLIGGLSAYSLSLSPIGIVYFGVDALYPGGWNNLLAPTFKETPAGYENIEGGLSSGFH